MRFREAGSEGQAIRTPGGNSSINRGSTLTVSSSVFLPRLAIKAPSHIEEGGIPQPFAACKGLRVDLRVTGVSGHLLNGEPASEAGVLEALFGELIA